MASRYINLATSNNQFGSFGIKPKKRRWIGKVGVSFTLALSILLLTFAPYVPDGSVGSGSLVKRGFRRESVRI